MPFLALVGPALEVALAFSKKAFVAAFAAVLSMRKLTLEQWLVVTAMAVGVWAWAHFAESAACSREAAAVRAALQRAAAAEHTRRETEIAKAREAGGALSEALARKTLDLSIRLKEFEDASHAADNHPCLDRAGVLRLNRLAR